MPTQFKQAKALRAELEPNQVAQVAQGTPSQPLAGEHLASWWRSLGNTELDTMVDRALANNTDLRIATLRILQSKARAEQAEAGRWPTLTLPFQAKGEGPSGGIGSLQPGEKRETKHTYQLSLRADWRADIWGELGAQAESAYMQLVRNTYNRDNAQRLLIANLATLYVEYLSLNDRIRVARETETVLRDMLASVSKRLEIGDATITDLEQQRTAVYAVQATIPALELQRETIMNAIAQLLGVPPVSLALSEQGLDSLRFSAILPGVPASLILHRPDIRVVEARLLSANADIEVARARLLPPLDLTAQAGYGSLVFSRLFQSHNLFWAAIANLTATIFDHGKRSSEVDFSRALHEELVESYVATIYTAIREADDAIATIQMTGKRIEAQAAATDAAKRAWDFSIESYTAGAVDYLTLIDTQRTYHRSLDELLRIRMERLKGVVSLFSALGGGNPREEIAAEHLTLDTAGAEAALATNPELPQSLTLNQPQQSDRWYVELAGVYGRAGIVHVWRDLLRRFPDLLQDRKLMPRMTGNMGPEADPQASWYRLYIAHFTSEETARGLCDKLIIQLQRCTVIAGHAIGHAPHFVPTPAAPGTTTNPGVGQGWRFDDLIVPLTLQQVDAALDTAKTVDIAPRIAVERIDGFLPELVVPLRSLPNPVARP